MKPADPIPIVPGTPRPDPFHAMRSRVPDSFSTLDDAVLVYTSDGGIPPEGRHREGCCGETIEQDGVDSTPYTEVVFKGERRSYYLNCMGTSVERGTWVIVEAEKGMDLGMVGCTGHEAYLKTRMRMRPCEEAPRKVLRLAEQQDLRVLNYHREQESTGFDICLEKIHKLGLPMKLVDVEFQFDRNRITFYFTADGRVDFRELVRELAAEYRTRIELRQIGPRDEARRMGGYGVCGRELCCNSWLGTFEPISTEMARVQNLALNPFKLAGQCGRLKCCLAYEMQVYEELLRKFPPLEYTFQTPRGTARIEKIDIFQDAIYVHFQKHDAWERMTLDQVRAFIPDTPDSASTASPPYPSPPQAGEQMVPDDRSRRQRPGETISREPKPEGRKPESRKPEARKLDGRNSEGSRLEAQKPEQQQPEQQKPDQSRPEGQRPQAQQPNSQNVHDPNANGRKAYEQKSNGQKMHEQKPQDQRAHGSKPNERKSPGR